MTDFKDKMIPLPEDEQALAHEAAGEVAKLEHQLGQIRKNFLLQETNLMNRILESEAEYQNLQKTLLKKHVRGRPGNYRLVPEIGAFVEVPAIGTAQVRGHHDSNTDPTQEHEGHGAVDRREDQQRSGHPRTTGTEG